MSTSRLLANLTAAALFVFAASNYADEASGGKVYGKVNLSLDSVNVDDEVTPASMNGNSIPTPRGLDTKVVQKLTTH